jgi:citrate lyase subunit beta/citryl-CoA lyase
VETPTDVFTAVARLQAAGAAEAVTLSCLLESAAGIEAAFDIARSHPRVRAISLGEADLRSDLGLPAPDPSDTANLAGLTGPGPGGLAGLDPGLSWARSRVVVAARAAGLPPPLMSVHPHVSDLDGLAATCRAGRRLGFVGRTCIHPCQVPVVVRAFRPTEAELTRAGELLAALAAAEPAGLGVLALSDGRMVDPAMAGAAHRTVALADAATRYLET